MESQDSSKKILELKEGASQPGADSEKSQKVEYSIVQGSFGDDVINLDSEFKLGGQNIEKLKGIGEKLEAKIFPDSKSKSWADPKKVIEQKLKEKYHKDRVCWMTKRVECTLDPFVQFHNEIVEFCKIYGPSEEDYEIRRKFFSKVKREIKFIWPDAKVKVFGSTATKLYLPMSDLDVVVRIPGFDKNSMKFVRKLQSRLARLSWTRSCEPIIAKVPIVKLEDTVSNLYMDISFNKSNGVAAVSFIKKYMTIYPEMHFLILVLKAFLKTRGLNETYHGGLSSYLITLLVISYLQEISKYEMKRKLLLSEHLMNFFDLYGTKFNYRELGLSIRKGGFYFKRSDRDWENFQRPISLCVENPQDPTVDIGKAAHQFTNVQQAFQHAYDQLKFNSSSFKSILQCILTEIPLRRKKESDEMEN